MKPFKPRYFCDECGYEVFEKVPICNNCNEKMSIKNPENGRGDYNVKCPVCKNELKESKSKHIFFD